MPFLLRAGAIALALVPAPAIPQSEPTLSIAETLPSPFRASFEAVPFVRCTSGGGTGVRISDDIVVTANHVATLGVCSIDDHVMAAAYSEPDRDFAALRSPDLGGGYREITSCEGIHPGERYLSMGYANGGKPNVEPLIGTNQREDHGLVMMRGRIYHGDSGGPVLNEEGAVVGINVAIHPNTDWALVLPLTETYLCK